MQSVDFTGKSIKHNLEYIEITLFCLINDCLLCIPAIILALFIQIFS